MRPSTRIRAGIRIGVTLCAVALAWVMGPVAVAEVPDIPRWTSILENKELAPLRALLLRDDNDEAERLARERLEQVNDPDGAGAAEEADLLEVVLDAHIAAGSVLPDAMSAEANRILALREAAFGKDDLRLVPILWRQVLIDFYNRDLENCRLQADRALEIAERHLPPDHPDLVPLLRAAGGTRYHAGDIEGGLQQLRRCVDLGERTRGRSDEDVITCLSTMANIPYLNGDLQAALDIQRSIHDRLVHGGNLKAYWAPGQILGLASWSRAAGLYAEAGRALEESDELMMRVLDPSSPKLAVYLTYSGWEFLGTGEYLEARSRYLRALEIMERNPRSFHGQVLDIPASLADVELRLGNLAAARGWAERALDEARRWTRGDSLQVQSALVALGGIELVMADFNAARSHLEAAVSIRPTDAHRSSTPGLVYILLAIVQEAAGDSAAGESTARAVAELEAQLTKRPAEASEYFASPVARRALSGGPPSLIPLLERTIGALEASYGPDSTTVAIALDILASLRLRSGDFSGAMVAATQAEAMGRRHLRMVSGLVEERLALHYAAVRPTGTSVLLSIAARSTEAGVLEGAWATLALSRGLVLDEMAMRHHAVSVRTDPATRALAAALARARERYSAAAIRGLTGEDKSPEASVESLRAEVDRLESDLAAVGQQAPASVRRELQAAELIAAIPNESAVVSYARYRTVLDPSASDSYLAFVASASGVRVVPLGAAAVIDEAVGVWRKEAAVSPRGSTSARRAAEARYGGVSRHLAGLIWDPLGIDPRSVPSVFIVPDGTIHLVSFGTLKERNGRYLQEAGLRIHYLGSERDLVRPPKTQDRTPHLLAFGGPQFDRIARDEGPPDAFRGARAACDDVMNLSFGPLAGARKEVQEIASMWEAAGGRAASLTGPAASEGAVKSLAPMNGVLHFATHALVWGDDCPGGSPRPEVRSAIPVENPLRMSFLALAGANRRGEPQNARSTPGPISEAREDGVLTAEEIASLDLSGVQWAVLSACDTARGPVLAGEGVLGLQRAFAVAGVATTIMSLWPVEDDDARLWMVNLYRHRLAGATTADAVHAAGLDTLMARRARGLDTHPAHWGAFIAAGDWR